MERSSATSAAHAQSHPEAGGCPAAAPVVLDVRVVTGTGGGPDKTILNSPRFLAPSYRMVCAYMHPPGDPGFEQLRRRARALGAPLRSVPDRGAWDGRVLAHLLRLCRQERVAIWHGHDYKSDAIGLLLRPFWPMHLVTTVHGWGVAGARPLYQRIDRLCLPRYRRVICVSEDLRRQCLACGVPEDRCVQIDNAIDTEQFRRTCAVGAAKVRLGIPADRLVVGAIGRLSGEKGYDRLIRAADLLLDAGLDLELVIVGEGDQRPQLEALIAALGRGDRIRLPGYRAETRPWYEAMDVLALSSLSEGLPNVLLEAMALEVPVVATRIADIPRLITPERDGLLVEPGSVADLAGALTRLLRDDGLRARLRREGLATIQRGYRFEVRMQKVRALYDELLGRSGPASPPRATTP
jgi:glycosyltransferase involved in cell wall biosynthesis